MSESRGVADRLAALRERIARTAESAGRDPAGVRLIGVAKRQPPERVAAAVRAGLRDIGENYVQEAAAKLPKIKELLGVETASPRCLLVGRLQRNKARDAVALFDEIHSVDRASLAVELARQAARAARVLPVLLQVDLAGEPQKGGATPDALPDLLDQMVALPSLRAVGLMAIPRAQPDPEAMRPAFRALRALRDAMRDRSGGANLEELSMGMSDDFEVAIEEGATQVRIGTALFGAREA